MVGNDLQEEIKAEDIIKRLDLIAYLLLEQKRQEKSSREIIKELSEWGLKPFEIAKILGKSSSYIRSELTQIRKSVKKQKVKKNEG